MENTITYDGNKMTIEKQNPAVTVSKAGVVEINNGYIKEIFVNTVSMIKLIDEAICMMKQPPVTDVDGRFAGRVTITVEFLGDMKEKNVLEDAENEENSHPV